MSEWFVIELNSFDRLCWCCYVIARFDFSTNKSTLCVRSKILHTHKFQTKLFWNNNKSSLPKDKFFKGLFSFFLFKEICLSLKFSMIRRLVACRHSVVCVSSVDVVRRGRSDRNFVCVLLHLQLTVKNVTAWLTFAFPSKKELKAEGFSCASAIVSLKSRTSSIDAQARVIRLGDSEEQKSIRQGLFLSVLFFTTSNQIKLKCENERAHRSAGSFNI